MDQIIPSSPRLAPSLLLHFFCADLNVLDWGEQGHLAIALSDAVYVMDTNKGGVKHLCSMESGSQYISSVLWSKTGKYLAVGTSNAEVQVRKCLNISCMSTSAAVALSKKGC